MGAVGDGYVSNSLELETNGVKSLFVHHGASAGVGGTEGNAGRNLLRNVQLEALKDGTRPPDIIYTGHVHVPNYTTLSYRKRGFEYGVMHYVITPSWQMKTRYAWQRAPVAVNRIGGVIHEIKADGLVTIPRFVVMET